MKRILACALLLALLLSAAGCSATGTGDASSGISPLTVTSEPPLTAKPAAVLGGVETESRVVSLIFEGYTDDATMKALADILEEREVPATFFVSGITANENTDIVRMLALQGFAIGSYGMSGGKHLDELSARENLRRFSAARVRRMREQERIERLKKQKKKQEAEKKKKAAAEQKKKEKQKQLPPPEVSDEPGTIRILLRIVGDVLDTFFGRLRVKMLRLRIAVGASDAAKTAITYGIVSQGVACLMELIAQKTRYRRVKRAEVEVVPDYLAQKTTAEVDLRFGLSLADLIVTGVKLGVRFLREKYPVRPRVGTNNSKRSVERHTIQKG